MFKHVVMGSLVASCRGRCRSMRLSHLGEFDHSVDGRQDSLGRVQRAEALHPRRQERALGVSIIILQYIDEAFADIGPSLVPPDPHQRAAARFWAAYIDDKLVIPWVRSFRGKTEEEKSEWIEQTFIAVETLEGALRESSKGKGFFGGDNVGLVDVVLGSLLTWVHATEVMSGTKMFDPAKTPLLAAWMQRFDELDGAKAVMSDVNRMVEFKTRQAQAISVAAASQRQ
ncbi:unnamed protein product [Triticum turgidum subsp. durum]|uniref:GST C-terminal domain-containing protein n=1 Tax=Triticum turgidum subsp. durum TaxID=4567 RepID=A0A9R0V714_TRITD|nr:unnamed protein product [Triticum turgidum subsp. durum]